MGAVFGATKAASNLTSPAQARTVEQEFSNLFRRDFGRPQRELPESPAPQQKRLPQRLTVPKALRKDPLGPGFGKDLNTFLQRLSEQALQLQQQESPVVSDTGNFLELKFK